MCKENNLSSIEIKRLEKFKNPSVTKVIRLSEELDIDIEILAKYFIDRISSEMEEENKNIKKGD